MIHRGRGEGCKVLVAGITLPGGRNVIGRFAQGRNAMTGRTTTATDNNRWGVGVAQVSRPRVGRFVAGVALRRRWRVITWFDLGILRKISPAVAGSTLTKHGRSVQHDRRRPTGKTLGMTGVALSTDRNVACRLGKGIYRDITTTVASRTLAGQASVVHQSWLESQLVLVAVVAGSASRNMVGRFAKSFRAVVACRANPGRIRVHKGRRCPSRSRRMAGVALCISTDVA